MSPLRSAAVTAPALALLLLAAAVVPTGVPTAVVDPAVPTAAAQIDGIVETIERIDRVLESIVDLVQTINQLFGGGD